MCIPPEGEDPAPHFAELAGMAERNGLAGLSMGMSADFETAIALGATHVRVGSAIFGVGWGMAGFCPGPALASLSLGLAPVALFVVAMLAGMTLHDRVWSRRMG